MIKALIDYQNKDVELFKIEKELMESEDRKKAVTAKKYLESVEENLSKLDLRAGELDSAFKKALSEKQKLTEELAELKTASSSMEGKEEAEFILKKVEQVLSLIKKLTMEIERLDGELKAVMAEHAKIAKTTKNAKDQYDVYGRKYKELKESKASEITAVKKELESLASLVEEGLLKLYQEKRKSLNRCPILFKVNGDACGACNMGFPQNTLNKLKNGEVIVCESCGRLIYSE